MYLLIVHKMRWLGSPIPGSTVAVFQQNRLGDRV